MAALLVGVGGGCAAAAVGVGGGCAMAIIMAYSMLVSTLCMIVHVM